MQSKTKCVIIDRCSNMKTFDFHIISDMCQIMILVPKSYTYKPLDISSG